jgi:hypothetical protein
VGICGITKTEDNPVGVVGLFLRSSHGEGVPALQWAMIEEVIPARKPNETPLERAARHVASVTEALKL